MKTLEQVKAEIAVTLRERATVTTLKAWRAINQKLFELQSLEWDLEQAAK